MKLNTKILDAKGEPVSYEVVSSPYNPAKSANPVEVTITAPGIGLLGWMRYSVYTDNGFLKIRRMENTSLFRHVGTALFEYAFRKSIEVGMGGKIETNAIEISPGAYFNMGFRKKSIAADFLNCSIQAYLLAPTPKNKNKIQSDSWYSGLVQEAAINLNKPEMYITFEEAIHHGCVANQQNSDFKEILDSRKDFKKLLNMYSSSPTSKLKDEIVIHAIYPKLASKAKDAKQKIEKMPAPLEEISFEDAIRYGDAGIERVNWVDCYTCGMHGTMFLPDETIAQKKIEFEMASSQMVADKVPRGSSLPHRNTFFVPHEQQDDLITFGKLALDEFKRRAYDH